MTNLQLTKLPVAGAAMLIRKPVIEVFEAFVEPAITTKFWFTKSTGRLEAGKRLTWTWEMYDVSVDVVVKEIQANKKIVIEWGNYGEMTKVEWVFTPYRDGAIDDGDATHGDDPTHDDATYVTITNSGFQGDGDKVVKDALDSTGGFTWVLAGLKALLERGVELNATQDAFPKGLAAS